MLQLLLIVPIIGSLLTMLVPETTIENRTKIKNIAIITAMVNFIVSIILLVLFDSSISDYQFVTEFAQLSFCHFNVGLDSISLFFVLITTFLTPVSMMSNYGTINKNVKVFFVALLILETLQIALFVVLDLFLFYIFLNLSCQFCLY